MNAESHKANILRFTGHPFMDLSVAAITAFSGLSDPESISRDDLDKFADYVSENYRKYLSRELTTLFPNSYLTNPTIGAGKIQANKDLFLYGYRNEKRIDEKCIFFGAPAITRACRQTIPLVTGEGIINFAPRGNAGFPICGEASLALHALPLGCHRVGGRWLAIHSDSHDFMLKTIGEVVGKNRERLLATRGEGEKSLLSSVISSKTTVMHYLSELYSERELSDSERELSDEAFSITAYQFTNYGTNPEMRIFHLPSSIIEFFRLANQDPVGAVWRKICRRAWQYRKKEKQPKGASSEPNEYNADFTEARNYLYDDLFDAEENPGRFIRTYFLRIRKTRRFGKLDPRSDYDPNRELDLLSWPLVYRFLRKAARMDRERIDAIRDLGDNLTAFIRNYGGKKVFRRLFAAGKWSLMRNNLIKWNLTSLKEGANPLFTFDDFLLVFEESPEAAYIDWRLAWDLLTIRVMEQLHKHNWFASEREVLDELTTETDDMETT